MANDEDTGVDLRAYKLQLVNELMTEIFKIIKAEQKVNGVDFGHEIAMTFLASFISTCIFNGLRSAPGAYGETKERLENAIATGFSGGFVAHDPAKFPDFLCNVKQVDDGKPKGLPS